MVVKISWKPMVSDLLENDQKRVNKLLEILRSLFCLVLEVIECSCHY